MGLLGGMPQTDYDFFHNTAPSSALVGRQVSTGGWYPQQPAACCAAMPTTQHTD